MPVDLKRLIPEHFLTSRRLVELLEVLEEWFQENWGKIAALREAYSPDTTSDTFLDLSTDLVGWTDVTDIVVKDRRGDLLRFSIEGWKVAGSRRFWEMVMHALGSSLTFRNQDTTVIEYSGGGTAWSTRRWQDADYYREAVFVTHMTVHDMSLFEYVREWFPAGTYLYYILQWAAIGSEEWALQVAGHEANVLWKLLQASDTVPHQTDTNTEPGSSGSHYIGQDHDNGNWRLLAQQQGQEAAFMNTFSHRAAVPALTVPASKGRTSEGTVGRGAALGDVVVKTPPITTRTDSAVVTE